MAVFHIRSIVGKVLLINLEIVGDLWNLYEIAVFRVDLWNLYEIAYKDQNLWAFAVLDEYF
jgi:hypothetical protein